MTWGGRPPDRRDAVLLVERTGLPYNRWQLLLTRGWRALLAGDLSTGERLNDEALAIASDIGAPEGLGAWGAVLFHIPFLQGRTEELIEPLPQTAAENTAIDVLRVALASAYCLLGRLDEAAPLFERDAATAFTEIPRDNTWITSMGPCPGECRCTPGIGGKLPTLYDLMLPYGEMVAFNMWDVPEGALARSLGRLAHFLGHSDMAEAHFWHGVVDQSSGSPRPLTGLHARSLTLPIFSGTSGRPMRRQALVNQKLGDSQDLRLCRPREPRVDVLGVVTRQSKGAGEDGGRPANWQSGSIRVSKCPTLEVPIPVGWVAPITG